MNKTHIKNRSQLTNRDIAEIIAGQENILLADQDIQRDVWACLKLYQAGNTSYRHILTKQIGEAIVSGYERYVTGTIHDPYEPTIDSRWGDALTFIVGAMLGACVALAWLS